ncbi:hypothetical protein PCE1_001710 [Barthelona sp. PCE]
MSFFDTVVAHQNTLSQLHFVSSDRTLPVINSSFKQLLSYFIEPFGFPWSDLELTNESDEEIAKINELQENCIVESRKLPGVCSYLVRSVTRLEQQMDIVLSGLNSIDLESRIKYDEYFSGGEVLQDLDYQDQSHIVHLNFKSPFNTISKSMDMVLLRSLKQAQNANVVMLLNLSVEHAKAPVDSKTIRLTTTCSGFLLGSLPDGSTLVYYLNQFAPGMYLPSIITHRIMRSWALMPAKLNTVMDQLSFQQNTMIRNITEVIAEDDDM